MGFMHNDTQETNLDYNMRVLRVQLVDLHTNIEYGPIVVNKQIIIGSSSGNASLKLPGDSHISRNHCMLFPKNSILYIKDIGSKNGTFVQKERIFKERPLRSGDVIRVGDTSLCVTII